MADGVTLLPYSCKEISPHAPGNHGCYNPPNSPDGEAPQGRHGRTGKVGQEQGRRAGDNPPSQRDVGIAGAVRAQPVRRAVGIGIIVSSNNLPMFIVFDRASIDAAMANVSARGVLLALFFGTHDAPAPPGQGFDLRP
jgi:hypothetical protein